MLQDKSDFDIFNHICEFSGGTLWLLSLIAKTLLKFERNDNISIVHVPFDKCNVGQAKSVAVDQTTRKQKRLLLLRTNHRRVFKYTNAMLINNNP